MHQILGNNANIGSSNVYIQLYKEVNGKLTLDGNPNYINEYILTRYKSVS